MGLVDRLVAVQNQLQTTVSFVGQLVWWTIGELQISRDDLQTALEQTGLGTKYLPRPINARDAFRRATSAAEVKRQKLPTKPGEREMYVNLLVREVAQDKKFLVRHMVRELVDQNNVRLEYREILRFRLEGDVLQVEPLDTTTGHDLEAIAKQVTRAYQIEKDHYNDRHLRDIFLQVAMDCDAISVRESGAVYFIPSRFDETVAALKDFARWLDHYRTGSRRIRCWSVPVVEADENKEMLAESLEEQVKHESQAMLAEIRRLLNGEIRTITPLVCKQYAERARNLQALVKRYEEMLDLEIEQAKSAAELAIAGAAQLFERVEVDNGALV